MIRFLTFAILLALAGAGFAQKAALPTPVWKAGAASVKITPETLMWMAGFAGRNKPADGVTVDLFAKALAIEDGQGERVVLVTLDLIGVPRTLRQNVAARAQKELGLLPARLLLNASHTHSGPELRARGLDDPNNRDAEADAYTAKLEGTLVQLIGQALAHLQPAHLRQSHARCGFAMNRRTPTPKGYTNHPYPQGPVDHQVPVLHATAADGAEIAILFGYNCHATTLGLYQFSGDYPGYAQQVLEEAHPGAVAMFMNGCSGDQNPYPRNTVELAQTHGRSLATAVEAALTTDMNALTGAIKSAYNEIALTYSPTPTEQQLAERKASTNKLDAGYATRLLGVLKERGNLPADYPYPVQVIRLGGGVTMVALGGEVVVDYGLRLKREIQDPFVWMAGYSNDVMTYIPSLRVLKEGGYEAGDAMKWGAHPAPWSEKVEEQIVGEVHRLRKLLE